MAIAETVAAALETKGWCVVDDALPATPAAGLARECNDGVSQFKPAGTGRRGTFHRDATMRSDAIRWIDGTFPEGAHYLAAMEALRSELNRRLLLGLFDYECHYARYVPGARYRKHVDAFAGERNRVLSTVFYLNADWREEEGGELLLYEGDALIETVLPRHNRLVVFLSERFPHEVKPATRARHSIAGWFRVRS